MPYIVRPEQQPFTIQTDINDDGVMDTITGTRTVYVTEYVEGDTLAEDRLAIESSHVEYQYSVQLSVNGTDEFVTVDVNQDIAELNPDTTERDLDAPLTFTTSYSVTSPPGMMPQNVADLVTDEDMDAIQTAVEADTAAAYEDSLVAWRVDGLSGISQLAWDDPLRYHSCGPAALLAILRAFGKTENYADPSLNLSDPREDDLDIAMLAGEMRTDSEDGTSFTQIQRLAAEYGLNVIEVLGPKSLGNHDEADNVQEVCHAIQDQLSQGRPVMISIDFETFMRLIDRDTPAEYATTHYVNIVGYEDGNYVIVDPYTGETFDVPRDMFEDGLIDFQTSVEAAADRKTWRWISVFAFEDAGEQVGTITDGTGQALTDGFRVR